MFNYMKVQHCDTFFTIAEACEILELTKDELRSKCNQYGVDLYNWNGQWGFPGEYFRRFNNTLYFEQCRDGCDDSLVVDLPHTNRPKASEAQPLRYIETIRGLEPSYTVEEACTLLGITANELEKICDEYSLLMFQDDASGVWFISCYDFLTLNNLLYRKPCEASAEGNGCV